jgi:hypothetical protein
LLWAHTEGLPWFIPKVISGIRCVLIDQTYFKRASAS